MSGTTDKIKGAANDAIGNVKQGVGFHFWNLRAKVCPVSLFRASVAAPGWISRQSNLRERFALL